MILPGLGLPLVPAAAAAEDVVGSPTDEDNSGPPASVTAMIPSGSAGFEVTGAGAIIRPQTRPQLDAHTWEMFSYWPGVSVDAGTLVALGDTNRYFLSHNRSSGFDGGDLGRRLGQNTYRDCGAIVMPAGAWFHLLHTVPAASSGDTIYIKGVDKGPTTDGIGTTQGTAGFWVGSYLSAGNTPLESGCKICLIRVWDAELDADQRAERAANWWTETVTGANLIWGDADDQAAIESAAVAAGWSTESVDSADLTAGV